MGDIDRIGVRVDDEMGGGRLHVMGACGGGRLGPE